MREGATKTRFLDEKRCATRTARRSTHVASSRMSRRGSLARARDCSQTCQTKSFVVMKKVPRTGEAPPLCGPRLDGPRGRCSLDLRRRFCRWWRRRPGHRASRAHSSSVGHVAQRRPLARSRHARSHRDGPRGRLLARPSAPPLPLVEATAVASRFARSIIFGGPRGPLVGSHDPPTHARTAMSHVARCSLDLRRRLSHW